MKVVIIGGTGLIGSKLVIRLREHGHEAVLASPDSGVNTLRGEGLADVRPCSRPHLRPWNDSVPFSLISTSSTCDTTARSP